MKGREGKGANQTSLALCAGTMGRKVRAENRATDFSTHHLKDSALNMESSMACNSDRTNKIRRIAADISETQREGASNKLSLKHVKVYHWGTETAFKSFSRLQVPC